jgi:hypothetical protein
MLEERREDWRREFRAENAQIRVSSATLIKFVDWSGL